jgi:hypothetical protein
VDAFGSAFELLNLELVGVGVGVEVELLEIEAEVVEQIVTLMEAKVVVAVVVKSVVVTAEAISFQRRHHNRLRAVFLVFRWSRRKRFELSLFELIVCDECCYCFQV